MGVHDRFAHHTGKRRPSVALHDKRKVSPYYYIMNSHLKESVEMYVVFILKELRSYFMSTCCLVHAVQYNIPYEVYYCYFQRNFNKLQPNI